MWVEQSSLVPSAKTESPKRGRPPVYTDAPIQGLLGLKTVFHLQLRALQGFAQSLRTLVFPTLPVPNYTTLSRRAQHLNVVLPASHASEPLHLVIDSTGLKLYGEGEWKVHEAIDVIEKSSRREWKVASGYHRRSLAETSMYRLKTLTGHSLWAREIGSQATEMAIGSGVLNRMTTLARPESVRIA
ncbi:hypothetical protein THI4931_19070 [Pandoraea sputorum]|nr:hypothetical protein THI4931_19070 [Pandoraea sputorum]